VRPAACGLNDKW